MVMRVLPPTEPAAGLMLVMAVLDVMVAEKATVRPSSMISTGLYTPLGRDGEVSNTTSVTLVFRVLPLNFTLRDGCAQTERDGS